MTRNILLIQVDGKLPNLALMRLSAYHKKNGDNVSLTRSVRRDLFNLDADMVYASAIFKFSDARLERLKKEWPNAIIGGTGANDNQTLEQIVPNIPVEYDYSPYPNYKFSIGFLQRGCRLKCKFCVVPQKEGKPRQEMTVAQLWRGGGHPKKLHILDNDFFGVPGWHDHIRDIREGGFKVCLNQGINVRMINDEAAEALASIEYRDDQFQQRRIYTAWDNIGQRDIFMRGMDTLEKAGIPPKHVMAYMLIGYDKRENWETIIDRFDAMKDRGISPYPMVYENRTYDGDHRTLKHFQRWALRLSQSGAIKWSDYDPKIRSKSAAVVGVPF
jgi:hypothetical protein|tara:strand:- start:19 stop:1005 length:987 start_codon:yes stop_codon:yes gene_type:complete